MIPENKVDPRNYPIKETRIVDGVCTLSIGVGLLDPALIRIIRQYSTDLVTYDLTGLSNKLSMKIFSLLNTNQSRTFVVGLQCNIVGDIRNIICTSLNSRNSVGGRSRIRTPGVNKYILSPIRDTDSKFLSCTGIIEKFNTHVHVSVTQERNMYSSCIEKVGVKSILSNIVKEFDSSGQENLTNTVLSESPKFKCLGHPTVETADIQNINFATSTREKSLNGMGRGNERYDRLGYTHEFESMSETTAYRNHIMNSELQTREVFVWETWIPENIQRTLPTDIVT